MDNPLIDGLNIEQRNFSDADLRSEVINNIDDAPTSSSGNHQKQQVERKAITNEELVKYMSNLPSYLQKGENLKEKALSVGVLEWRRLQKWQYSQKKMPCQGGKYLSSSSNTSFFSTDGSSTRSSPGQSCSPSHQMMHRPTLQSHLNEYPRESYSQGVKNIVQNVRKFQDSEASSSNSVKGQRSVFTMYHSFSKEQSEIKLKESKKKDMEHPSLDLKNFGAASRSKGNTKIQDCEIKLKECKKEDIEHTSLDLKKFGAASRAKGNTKIQDGEYTSGVEELQKTRCLGKDNYEDRCKTVVLQRDDPESSHSGRRSTEASRRSFMKESFSEEVHIADRYSGIPHSCSLPCEDDNSQRLQIKQPSSVDAKTIKFASEPSHPQLCSSKMSISPSRVKKLEEKSSKVMPLNSIVNMSSEGVDLKNDTVEPSKSRNPSPNRRFSFGLGRAGQTSTSKDRPGVPQLSSEPVKTKSGSEKAVASSYSENLSNDKLNGTRRSHSSPLRRLLDPLLKPKAINSHHSAETSEKDPTSTVKACKSSNRLVESSTVQSVKVKLDLKNCKTINVENSHRNGKCRSSTVQALLQIAIKNGLPLFTFADDNNSHILVATMRKASATRKDDNGWVYTFFNVHEVKKKSGWKNQGSKGKSIGYIPNVVAQMTVSMNELSTREFVLFAVNLTQADQHASDLQSNNELAAIVVKFPKETLRSLNEDGQQSDSSADSSLTGLGESLPETRGYPDSMENKENGFSAHLPSTTVILPSGVHGLPSKGEPSPLIERWKSGGVCDCGGWDMGCRLRVLATNRNKVSKRSSSSKSHHTGSRFELFSQGEEVVDDSPVFRLSPFKEGIFSVEFNSSLSFLQAFSICISVLNSWKPYELSELIKLWEEKSSEETTLVVNDDEIKALDQAQPEVPASFASYPPLLPVGRV